VENERSYRSGFSGISVTAALSVVVLLGAVGWKIEQSFQDKGDGMNVVAGAAAADHSGIGNDALSGNAGSLGEGTSSATDPSAPAQITDSVANTLAYDYAAMQANGTYSTSSATALATAIGAGLKASVTYKQYSASDIKTDPDTSYARMLTYRAALQTSFAPLLKNTTPEIDMLTSYVKTNDPKYLTQLQQAADNYKLAAVETAQVVVPKDAVAVQVGILNAMQEFAATLDQMAASASDPFTEATLLNTYMQAQGDMFSSFNNLYGYEKNKQQ
jgi:hypothetical protein